MVFSFWPYEDEAIRTIWESLKVIRAMEKQLKGKGREIEGLKKQIGGLEQEPQDVKDQNFRLKEVIKQKDEYIEKLQGL
jgi:hypothetical protein